MIWVPVLFMIVIILEQSFVLRMMFQELQKKHLMI